jgi:glucokinase
MASPVVLGLDFGGSKTAAAVADINGLRLGQAIVPVTPSDARQTLASGIAAARALLDRVAGGRPLAAVGACTFGIPHEDRIELAPNIAGWEQLAFGAELREAFPGAPLRMATDVKAAARAEVEDGALTGCDPGLYINLGTGLAAALVVGGVVVTGHHAASGEIGYNLRSRDAAADSLRLEGAVSGKALETAALQLVGRADAGALLELAETDSAAAQFCAQFVTELSFHLVNLTIAIDPQRVVIGGGLVRSWPRFGPAVVQAVTQAVPFPPEVVVAAHPYDAPLIGALALARSAVADLYTVADVITEGASA